MNTDERFTHLCVSLTVINEKHLRLDVKALLLKILTKWCKNEMPFPIILLTLKGKLGVKASSYSLESLKVCVLKPEEEEAENLLHSSKVFFVFR